MKRIIIAGVLVLSSQSALAAGDSLAGFYAGLNLGVAQGTFTSTEYEGPWDYGEYSLTSGLEPTYGIQLGYNFAPGKSSMFGVELGYSMPQIDESVEWMSGATPYKNSAEWNSEISLRLKGGLVVDDVWMYVMAGIVQEDVDFFFGQTNAANNQQADSVSNLGLSYGFGFATPVAQNLSLRGEVVLNDAESEAYGNFGSSTFPGAFHAETKSFVIGLNYRFF